MTTSLKDRKFWLEFMEEYRALPCLWDAHVASSKKDKDNAHRKLLKKVREMHPDADVPYVKQRINNFRRIFINEYNKVEESKRNGSKNIYVPNLYYYNQLKFIKENTEEEVQRQAIAIMEAEDGDYDVFETQHDANRGTTLVTLTELSTDDDLIDVVEKETLPSNDVYADLEDTEDCKPRKMPRLTYVSHNPAKSLDLYTDTLVETEDSHIHSNEDVAEEFTEYETIDAPIETHPTPSVVQTVTDNDEYDAIAKRIAAHFRSMNTDQRLYAEKLIFDVCINGRLNHLGVESRLTL